MLTVTAVLISNPLSAAAFRIIATCSAGRTRSSATSSPEAGSPALTTTPPGKSPDNARRAWPACQESSRNDRRCSAHRPAPRSDCGRGQRELRGRRKTQHEGYPGSPGSPRALLSPAPGSCRELQPCATESRCSDVLAREKPLDRHIEQPGQQGQLLGLEGALADDTPLQDHLAPSEPPGRLADRDPLAGQLHPDLCG